MTRSIWNNEDAGDCAAFNAADHSAHVHEDLIERASEALHRAGGYTHWEDALWDLRLDGFDVWEDDMPEIMEALERLRGGA